MRNIFITSFVILVLAGMGYWYGSGEAEIAVKGEPDRVLQPFTCLNEKANDFDCYRKFYSGLMKENEASVVFDDLKTRYEQNNFVSSQCHQIMHVIGFVASEKFGDVSEAYAQGDSFCWSGYYHGVLEGVATEIGHDNLLEKINDICRPLAQAKRYSFDHYNCVHGLGHGIMAIQDDELFDSLEICNLLVDTWDRASCWSGSFMENVMVDNRFHESKYLRPDDPLYPCNSVGEQYKSTCYLMQTSYMLTLVNNDFAKVFELCGNVEENYRDICYQSLGRDASGHSTSNVVRTRETCNLGKNRAQRENCIIGAVKDFISYLHDDTRAKELCMSLEEESLQNICLNTAESYYKIL